MGWLNKIDSNLNLNILQNIDVNRLKSFVRMSSKYKESQKAPSSPFSIKKLEEMHPHQTLVYLGIIGSCVIFSFLSIAFWFSVDKQLTSDEFPISFVISTIFILISSLSVNRAFELVKKEELEMATQWWWVSFILGVTFGVTQVIGWEQLQSTGVFLSGGVMGAYFYLISGLHLLHILGGLIFMLKQTLEVQNVSKDAVKALVFVTNPYEVLKLRLLKTYWHFMDGIWFIVFSLFLLSIL